MRRSARRIRSRKSRRVSQPKLPGAEITVHRRFSFALGKTATDTGRVLSTNLGDYSASELAAVFQYYRIRKVKVSWLLVNAPNNNANFPTLNVAPQNFTFIAPASLLDMQQYDKLRLYQFGPSKVMYSHTFIPANQLQTDATAGTAQAIFPGGALWMSTNNTTASYTLGSYWLERYSNVDVTHTIQITFDVTVSFKGLK